MNDVIAHLAQGRLRHRRMCALAQDLRPADETQAYALQTRLHLHYEHHGLGTIAGYKIGCTSAVMQEYLGIPNPCAGGLLSSTVHHGHGDFRHSDFVRVGVECELAIALARDLPGGGARLRSDDVLAAVDLVMCAIEVVDDRWMNYRDMDTPTLIADDFFGAGCVLGEGRENWRRLDLLNMAARMSINQVRIGQGKGGDILGDPLRALIWLANARSQHASADEPALAAGSIVLLGSMVQTCWLSPGDQVQIDVDGLGVATANFA